MKVFVYSRAASFSYMKDMQIGQFCMLGPKGKRTYIKTNNYANGETEFVCLETGKAYWLGSLAVVRLVYRCEVRE